MKLPKQWPLLATAVGMAFVALSTGTIWIKVVAGIIGLSAVLIVARSNSKKD